jgi:hypothetical protein
LKIIAEVAKMGKQENRAARQSEAVALRVLRQTLGIEERRDTPDKKSGTG